MARWDVDSYASSTFQIYTPGRPVGQVAYSSNWLYYFSYDGGQNKLYRYNWFFEESWDGEAPPPAPEMYDVMRHTKWFGSGFFQGFWLGWR